MTPQTPEAAWKQALRLVGREVGLRDLARHIELDPARREEAGRLYVVASLLHAERLRLLVAAGVLESAEPWTR